LSADIQFAPLLVPPPRPPLERGQECPTCGVPSLPTAEVQSWHVYFQSVLNNCPVSPVPVRMS
jgi:hypothetical protein